MSVASGGVVRIALRRCDGLGMIQIITGKIEEQLKQLKLPKKKDIHGFGVHVYVAGCTASHRVALSLNENCDDLVQSDLLRALQEIQSGLSSSQRSASSEALLEGSSLLLPADVRSLKLQLGTWQGVYLLCWPHGDSCGENVNVDLRISVFPLLHMVSRAHNCAKRSFHAIKSPFEDTQSSTISSSSSNDTKTNGGTWLESHLLKHTSASLHASLLQSSPATPAEMVTVANAFAPEEWNDRFFQHTYEGPDDMPGHCKSSLFGAQALVEPKEHVLWLGEHRDVGGYSTGHRRTVLSCRFRVQTAVTVTTSMQDGYARVPWSFFQEALIEHKSHLHDDGCHILHVALASKACTMWTAAVLRPEMKKSDKEQQPSPQHVVDLVLGGLNITQSSVAAASMMAFGKPMLSVPIVNGNIEAREETDILVFTPNNNTTITFRLYVQ